MWTVRLFRLLSWAAGRLPLSLLYGLAWPLAVAMSLMPTRRRAALRENIATAHGCSQDDPRVRRDTRRAFWHALLNYLDLLRLGRAGAVARILRIPIPSLAPIDEALARGKGLILVSAHLGNMDTVVQTLAVRGYRVLVPAEEIRPPELLSYMQAQREALGVRIEPIGPETMRLMTAHLREGGIVVILCDRDVQGTGVAVSLFGHQVSLPPAAVLLALRTGAPVIGGFGFRHANGGISGRLTEPLHFSKGREGGIRADLAAGMRDIVALLEREIRRDPGQWVVQQPIFSAPRPGLSARLHDLLAGKNAAGGERAAPAALQSDALATRGGARP
jgi:KDO2-lipid IV(A) lauroyltransferase